MMNVFLQPPGLSLGLCEEPEQPLLEWMKALEKLRSRPGLRDPSCLPPLASFTPHNPIMGDRLGSWCLEGTGSNQLTDFSLGFG